MNYKKLLLVGFISAFVAFLTSVMGVAGTVIGSVISSVLYNMLTEALEKPVNKAKFSHSFEWDIAYVFPLVVIAIIQLLLILALFAELGLLPYPFLNVYLQIQDFANNNLYRILGIASLIISAYPLVLKPEYVKKEHGGIIAIVGMIFLARGFVDLRNSITDIYDGVFIHFDLPIAIIAFVLLVFVIFRILVLTRYSENKANVVKHHVNEETFAQENVHRTHHSSRHQDFTYKRDNIRMKNSPKRANKPQQDSQNHNVTFNNKVESENKGINESSGNIRFESNDILDEYKK